jgi:hypothetical protein
MGIDFKISNTSPLGQFLERYFPLLFGLAFIWVVCAFGYLFFRRLRKGSIFPRLNPNEIIYQEFTASGCSYKTWWTKSGGAKNCLKLVVTVNELWITSWFPFNIMSETCDLEHRIPKDRIKKISVLKSHWSSVFLIDFLTDTGLERRVKIIPKNGKKFIHALDPDGKLQ